MWNKTILVFLSLVALQGCDRGSAPGLNDPKQRLNDYISKSFSVRGVDDRKALLEYLTGEAKTRLEAWSDEQFAQAFVDSKRQFVKLAFKEVKPLSASQVNITYELTYLSQPSDSKSHGTKILNKKLAEMVLDQGRWQVAEVKNLMQVLEYANEMSLP